MGGFFGGCVDVMQAPAVAMTTACAWSYSGVCHVWLGIGQNFGVSAERSVIEEPHHRVHRSSNHQKPLHREDLHA